MIPRKVFLTKGVGRSRERLAAFEMALRDAGIAHFNIVRVSSIFPPNCKIISREAGLSLLEPGQIVYCVLSDNASNEPNRLLAASVGIAIPADRSKFGYLSEHHSFGETDNVAGDYAEDLAAQMLATTLGIPFEEQLHYDERKETWKMRQEIVVTRNITQSAIGHKNGLWTAVTASAVFVE
jgi:arginine decarboxylase